MALIKSTFKRWNGSEWDIHYFRTSADLIDETPSFKVMTSAERSKISSHLTNFNSRNQLVKLNAAGKIPGTLIEQDFSKYLDKNAPDQQIVESNTLFTGRMYAPTVTLSSGETDGYSVGFLAELSATPDVGVSLKVGHEKLLFGPSSDGIHRLQGIVDPKNPNDAANKSWVEGMVASGSKPVPSVQAATTGNITLSGVQQKIDGQTLTEGVRILVKDQTNKKDNGIYTVQSGKWNKIDEDNITGALVFIEEGLVNNDSQYFLEPDLRTWVLFSRVDTITASGGLVKAGKDIRVLGGGITNTMLAKGIGLNKLSEISNPSKYNSWNSMSFGATSGGSVHEAILSFASAIRLLRGTPEYNTNNNITLNSLNTAVEARNRTYTGTTAPATTGFVNGDLYFQTIT